MKKVLFLLCLLPAWVQAQAARLTGKAPAYAGKRLALYAPADPFFRQNQLLASDTVDSNGHFALTVPVQQPRFAYLITGVYKAFIVLAPRQRYEVALPPFQPKTRQEELNPYFQGSEVYLKILNERDTSINRQIRMYDYQFEGYMSHIALQQFKRRPLGNVDSVLQAMDDRFADYGMDYLQVHKKYRAAYLKGVVNDALPRVAFRRYFYEKPVYLQHPVYGEVFSDLMNSWVKALVKRNDFFIPFSEYFSVRALNHYINNEPLLLNDTLRELSLLGMLYHGNYDELFHYKSVNYVLDSLTTQGRVEALRPLARRMQQEITRLKPGFPAPGFQLPDQDGIQADLRLFRGRFILLHFFATDCYSCMKELPLLDKLHQKYKKELAVVSISVDKDFENTLRLINQQGFDWTFLHYQKGQGILKKYDVVGYPSYFLLSPKGKIIQAPAPSPDQQLENTLVNYFREAERERLRKQHQKNEDNTYSPY